MSDRATKMISALRLVIALSISVVSASTGATVGDRENEAVESVVIGDQRWMKHNLAVTRFRNGAPIQRLDDESAWTAAGQAGTPAFAVYDNQSAPPAKWGLLYNFAAVIDPRGICPAGWRVPDNRDWQKLEAYLGGGAGAAKALKADDGWPGNYDGTNAAGFAGLPAGWRTQNGTYYLANRIAYFWTADLSPNGTVLSHMLFDEERPIFRIGYNPGMGQSLRCIK